MANLICQYCGYAWDYNGKMKVAATCPDCKRNVKIAGSKNKSRAGSGKHE